MSVEENKALVRRWIEAINKKNVAVFDEIFTANYVAHTPGAEENDPESIKQLMTGLFTAFPDLHLTVEDFIAEGDKVVHRLTVQGTHKGDLMGIPPTGKQFTIMLINITRNAKNKFAESWTIADLLGMMQQLGIIPSQ